MTDFFERAKIAKSAKPVNPSVDKEESSSPPWIEKYRPKDMNDISSQEEVVAVLEKTLESKNVRMCHFVCP